MSRLYFEKCGRNQIRDFSALEHVNIRFWQYLFHLSLSVSYETPGTMTTRIEQLSSSFGWDLINDLGALPENEDIIIDFLLERLQRGQIYTWVGPLLLALNPNNEVSTSHLYTVSEFDKYINMSSIIYEANPHIFAVATKAHYSLTKELGRNCQVIVISGETGTGKTFNAFKCLEFLSMVNKNSISPCQGDYTYNIMPRITDACRLISAFTTACTERNEVSSRHGQLLQLHYKGGAISGATINSFLLERSRVTKGSSNFQIFYQIMFGMLDTELNAFNLFINENYDLLSTIDYNKKKYFQEGFQDTVRTLENLKFEADQRTNIFQVLALLIHMGNIRFIQNSEACTVDIINQKSREALKNTSILSSLTEESVIELLTTALINPESIWRKHTAYHRQLSTIEACYNRLHTIIRHLYDLLFHWVLKRTNEILSIKNKCSEWLGILDIFGFESFNKNGIEQLCVNYANEKMQQYFMEIYLENSRKDLQDEGFIEDNITLDTINLYKERLNILEEILFLTLNDASQSPLIINMPSLIDLVCRNSHNGNQKIISEREGDFIIEHYSGRVAYSIKDLLAKNTDKIPNEVSIIFRASKNKFLGSLIDIEEEHLHSVKTCTKKRTVLAKLRCNINALIKELKKCDVHYVRCVRPNRLKESEWDRKDFRKQLACIGVFDALPLVKCKYPIRLHYKDFCQRYSKKPTENSDLNACKIILESVVPKRKLHLFVHYGKQMIFLTESVFFQLETCRRNYRIMCANKIKTFWIKHSKWEIFLHILFLSINLMMFTGRRTISTISKYSTINYTTQDDYTPNDEVSSIKNILGRKLKKLSNSDDDDVFITEPTSFQTNDLKGYPNSATKNEKETDNFNTEINMKKINSGNKKENSIYFKNQLKNLDSKHDIQNNITKFVEESNSDTFTESKNGKDFCKYTDDNNNPFKQYLGHITLNNSLTNTQPAENCDKQKCSIHYDEVSIFFSRIMVLIFVHTLFYKNGILSRRRLAKVAIRIYTRRTCLINSHVIPRSELPQGLQDCL
ncbi:LOW QUALITY PROTEIN: unconventional myosin-XIX [Calliopsis andreniformis]|uniref:LOW QUALITY PROTEIN: unconventional myosin-XIX n=1 Tax=Calliopsis andreniformis TaxID=337506 RepID=UPI003FCEB1CE